MPDLIGRPGGSPGPEGLVGERRRKRLARGIVHHARDALLDRTLAPVGVAPRDLSQARGQARGLAARVYGLEPPSLEGLEALSKLVDLR
jgi:hypothetical protein